MKLLTKDIKARFAKVPWRSTDAKPHDEVKVIAKFFHPCSRWTFYATEFDGLDIFFGYVHSAMGYDSDEWGYVSLTELQNMQVGKLGVERDISWNPETTVAEVLAGVRT